MPTSIRAIILDFGGVLVRIQDHTPYRRWETHLDLSQGRLAEIVFDTAEQLGASLGVISEEALWAHIGDKLGLSPTETVQLQQDFWSGQELNQTLVDFLDRLHPHLRLGILSNAWSEGRQNITGKYGLDRLADAIIISAEEGVAKPEAAIYTIAARRLGVRPSQAIFVDDTQANVEGAAAVGMHAIHFQDTFQAMAEIQALLGKDGA